MLGMYGFMYLHGICYIVFLLSVSYCLLGIPTLIIVDENYKILSSNGRTLVSSDPEAEVQ